MDIPNIDIRNDDERLDEPTDGPPPPVPVLTLYSGDDSPPATPPDDLVFGQTAQPLPAPAAPPVSLLGTDPADVQDRWHDLQASFVDDPRDAVLRADSLLDEVMASVRQALESHIRQLQDLWKNTDHNDTEQLRLALRSYRDALHKLLPLADDQTTP
jgi:hypothetical protein